MRSVRSIFLPLVAALALSGCVAGTEGEEGNFTFYDRTPPAQHAFPWDGDQSLSSPLAAGAWLQVGVSSHGIGFRPEGVTVDPASLATVESIYDTGFILKANAAGLARITVQGATREDHVSIVIRQPDEAEVLLRPWDWYPLPESYFDHGMAVLLGATSHLFGQARAAGVDLTGYGLHAFLPASVGDSVFAATSRQSSNFLDLKALAVGTEKYSFGPSAQVEVGVVTEADIASVKVLEAWHTQAGPGFVCRQDETLYMMVVPYDAQGRIVVGTTTGDAPTVEIPEASAPYLKDTTPANPSQELKETLQNRTAFLKCDLAGSGQATLKWRTFEVPVSVTIYPK